MEGIWDYPINIKDPHHPILTIVILDWEPFLYAVTLKAMIDGVQRDIRRWDNVGKPDHVDIFHFNGSREKHQISPVGKILKLGDLEEIFVHVGMNYRKMLDDYIDTGRERK